VCSAVRDVGHHSHRLFSRDNLALTIVLRNEIRLLWHGYFMDPMTYAVISLIQSVCQHCRLSSSLVAAPPEGHIVNREFVPQKYVPSARNPPPPRSSSLSVEVMDPFPSRCFSWATPASSLTHLTSLFCSYKDVGMPATLATWQYGSNVPNCTPCLPPLFAPTIWYEQL